MHESRTVTPSKNICLQYVCWVYAVHEYKFHAIADAVIHKATVSTLAGVVNSAAKCPAMQCCCLKLF